MLDSTTLTIKWIAAYFMEFVQNPLALLVFGHIRVYNFNDSQIKLYAVNNRSQADAWHFVPTRFASSQLALIDDVVDDQKICL